MWKYIVVILVIVFAYIWNPLFRREYVEEYEEGYQRQYADPEYDYVIVGGGTAGCILANRLSANSSIKVLLIEAGSDGRQDELRTVADVWTNMFSPRYTSGYVTTPQERACQLAPDKTCQLTQGHILGGGGSVNCMLYIRGAPQNYDRWAQDLGAEGWAYKDVLPYFLKAENNRDPLGYRAENRGRGGPVTLSRKQTNKLSQALLQAGKELGFPFNHDYNSGKQDGFAKVESNSDGDLRVSTRVAYLNPALRRPNLHVLTEATATKVLIEDGNRAGGVRYERKGVINAVKATREVILAASGVDSPKLLLLSGIGPKAHLTKLKIPVVADLPVGENFHDHPAIFAPSVHTDQQYADQPVFSLRDLLTTNGAANPCEQSAVAFMTIPHPDEPSTSPNLQISFMEFPNLMGHVEAYPEYFPKVSPPGLSFVILTSLTKSRGTITLRSQDHNDPPIVNYQLHRAKHDRDIAMEGLRIVRKLVDTTAMQALGARLKDKDIKFPPCAKHDVESDEYWECWMPYHVGSMSHYVGACRMGALNDSRTVVDPRLRVKGVRNLRVVDTSIIPEITSGNTNGPAIMIGEKGADMILHDGQIV